MTDRPILFSAPMIRALLDGRKTQTRRVLKKPAWAQDEGWPHKVMEQQALDGSLSWFARETGCLAQLPIPQPGDRLWVREAWRTWINFDHLKPSEIATDSFQGLVGYPATSGRTGHGRLRAGMFMPRWASRLTLTVTDVRVQRVQDISEADAMAEGIKRNIPGWFPVPGIDGSGTTARAAFAMLWDSLNAKRGFGWAANPWVAAYTFTVHRCNIDQMEEAA